VFLCFSLLFCSSLSSALKIIHNTIEWVGARLAYVTFSGEIFFPSKVLEFLHVLFNLVVKHFPVFFLAGLHFVSGKNEDKISKHAQ